MSLRFDTTELLTVGRLSKQTKSVLAHLGRDKGKYVVISDNKPVAVVLSPDTYNALMEELEDAYLGALAKERLATFDKKTALTHEEVFGAKE